MKIKTKRIVVISAVLIGVFFLLIVVANILQNALFHDIHLQLRLGGDNSMVLQYNGVVIEKNHFSAEYSTRFDVAKHTLFFEKIDEDVTSIQITIPDKYILNIYPHDNNSILLILQWKSITLQYKLSDYGDFNRHLELLYEETDNEVFKQKLNLPQEK